MNLIIDIGNTGTKVALTENGKILKKERLRSADPDVIEMFIGHEKPGKAIVSDVRNDPQGLVAYLDSKINVVHLLSWRSVYPFAIDYETPETLGVDRLAAAAGACIHHPGADLMIIDAGSAMTVDLLTEGTYHGGSISPGLTMRFRALHEYTGGLPLITKRSDFSYPGRTTEDAITAGVIMGLVYEINEYIRKFEENYNEPVAVITGGDSGLISELTDKKLQIYPDLVSEGLNYLLDTNV